MPNEWDESALEDNIVLTSDDAIEIEGDEPAPLRSRETPCSFVCGVAGSGKTHTVRKRIEENPFYAMVSASTGIASINLNTTTIHSLLGFFDTDSLRDAYLSGSAQRRLRKVIGEGYHNVVIDEVSMISRDTLDLLTRTFDDVNQNLPLNQKPIGLILVADFCQLPPIPESKTRGAKLPWAFEAITWPRYAANTTKLTKVWRQDDTNFLAALNYARRGEGSACAGLLAASGAEFANITELAYDGTTIVSQNTEVDRLNQLMLDRVKGRLMKLPARRWGKQRSEWKIIPEVTQLRDGAYVMLLSNMYDNFGNMVYANGDCGHVKGIEAPAVEGALPTIAVELVRNQQVVYVSAVVRGVESKDRPNETVEVSVKAEDDDGGYIAKVHYRGKARRYVTGQIHYWPIRLAYASTCHKIQGLSLDRIQIDFRSWAWSKPAMMYVALSRARTIQGLRLVGDKETLARKCKVDPKVLPWL